MDTVFGSPACGPVPPAVQLIFQAAQAPGIMSRGVQTSRLLLAVSALGLYHAEQHFGRSNDLDAPSMISTKP